MTTVYVGSASPANAPALIAGGKLTPESLAGQVVVVTGAGGGIGLEAARALLWLGASVVIAEIDVALGDAARTALAEVAAVGRLQVIATDVGNEDSVAALVQAVEERFGRIDAVINNATFAPAGAPVADTPVEWWDRSYSVNLRGPVLLARACLPGMVARKHGVFVCVSSTGGPYLAAYETLKSAQLALANSIDAELADSGVVAFTIGPGLVPTRTACAALQLLAPRLGMTVEEFWKMNRGAVVSTEAAGAGFAAAVALAERYAGQEISSTQALIDAGIDLPGDEAADAGASQGGDTAAALSRAGPWAKPSPSSCRVGRNDRSSSASGCSETSSRGSGSPSSVASNS
jgi:NAD(P)-dependent dehydrogenase (short-subunit alcohol dehydrogenase family)